MKSNNYQQLNNAGVDLLDSGRFNDARRCFVSTLRLLKKEKVTIAKRKTDCDSVGIATLWSSAPNIAHQYSEDSVFVWSRALRLIVPPVLIPNDVASLMAVLTFNSALCLHMTSSKKNPESVRWVVLGYNVVLKLLQKTQNEILNERMKIALLNNLASLHCQLLDYCEAYRWYGLLARHLKHTNWHSIVTACDRAGIIANLMFCCKPHVAGAA